MKSLKNYFESGAMVLFFGLLVLLSAGCTKKMADEAIGLLPFVGGDEELAAAISKKDPKECDKLAGKDDIATKNRQNRCYEETAVLMLNPDVCFLMQDPYDDEDASELLQKVSKCIIGIAKESKDAEMCEKIVGDIHKNNCYAELAPLVGDASLCSKAAAGSVWEKCIAETAKASKNQSICDNLDATGVAKARCQSDVAFASMDPTLCANVSRDDFHDSCLERLASELKDYSLCDQISTDRTRERCQQRTNAQ